MDYEKFYAQLFAPLEAELGPLDREGLFHIMGFDGGGPLNFSTFGRGRGGPFTTYVSCELAVRDEQRPSVMGRYELLCTCDDEEWVERVLSDLGRMSLRTAFGHGHTVDIGVSVGHEAPIQGVCFEYECGAQIDGETYSIYRVIGITRSEMDYKRENGSGELIDALKAGGVYPNTIVRRTSVV